MISLEQYAEVKELIIARYGDEAIRVRTGVGINTIKRIRTGRWRPQPDATETGRAETLRGEGPYVRCPDCGGKVRLPCVLCAAKDFRRREIESCAS